MSLFTFKELWSVDCGEGFSSFSPQSLVVANIDNASDGEAKFVLGSLSGFIRIIGSTEDKKSTDSPETDHSKTAVLTELNLGYPILQIEADIFVGGSDKLQLAILHPQKVAVYAVSKLQGQVEYGSQYKIALLYEHLLKRHAFNMCCGSFGHGISDNNNEDKDRGRKTTNRRFICVQSLDGTLSFFEQELFTFSRYLPGFLIPGQLAYVPSWDSFLTITSWNLVCFKYTSLAMAKDDPYQQQFQDTSVGKRMVADWIFSIGEECIGDIQVLSTEDSSTTSVVVCTFRNILGVGDGGQILWTKRLDYQISYFTSYLLWVTNEENERITITASSNEPYTCYVYNGTSLRWAAKLPFSPVHISRVSYMGVEGALVAVSHDGKMVLGCLGTVPSLFVAPPVQSRDLADYEAAEKELFELRQAITAAGDQSVTASKDSTVEIKLEFEGQKSKWIESNGLEVIALIGVLKLVCHLKVNDVRVTINTPKPITCNPDSVFIGDIIGHHNYQVEFFVDNEAIPSDLQCDVFVFYLNDSGAPHFVQKCGIKIPLFIVAKAHNRLDKDGDSKLTFSVNKPAVSLPTFFNDFVWNSEGNPAGISFILYGGETISLLSSTKMSNSASSKYRIQSSNLAAVYLVFRDFVDRLQRKLGREKDLVIEPLGFENEIPLLSDYFKEIDAHILRRRRDIQIKEDLSDRAAQLRAIQRRLLIRFRDKNPSPLTQLEILFEGSLDQVGDCLNFMEDNDMEKQKTECRLSGATKLLLELISIKHGSRTDDCALLGSALSPYIWNFSEEYGWEESVYTALTFIKSQVIVNQSFSNLDPSKLKKAIKSALEKGLKGSISKRAIVNQDTQKVEQSGNEKLIGNEIVERMTSARGRMARKMNPTLASIPEPVEGDEVITSATVQPPWSEENNNSRSESPNPDPDSPARSWQKNDEPAATDNHETSPNSPIKYNDTKDYSENIVTKQDKTFSDEGFW